MTWHCGVHGNSLSDFLVSPSTPLNWINSNVSGFATTNQDTVQQLLAENPSTPPPYYSLKQRLHTSCTVRIKMQVTGTIITGVTCWLLTLKQRHQSTVPDWLRSIDKVSLVKSTPLVTDAKVKATAVVSLPEPVRNHLWCHLRNFKQPITVTLTFSKY